MQNDEVLIIRIPEVLRLTSMSRTSLWRLVKSGDFPQPLQLGPRMTAFYLHEVREWIGSRRQAKAA